MATHDAEDVSVHNLHSVSGLGMQHFYTAEKCRYQHRTRWSRYSVEKFWKLTEFVDCSPTAE